MSTIQVSFIIPTMYRSKFSTLKRMLKKFHTLQDTIDCIKKNVTVEHEIIVVCNETQEKNFIHFIQNSKDIDRYCINSENVGVPRAWNMGAHMALGEYLCFVNDDVEIGLDSIEALVQHLEQNPTVAQVGSEGAMWYRTTPGDTMGTERIEEADCIAGFLFMVRHSVFTAVGGFDNAYTPALCEEIDFSFAIRNAGYKCHVIPHLNIWHHHVSGASSTNKPISALGFSLDRETLTARNRAYFEKKWEKFWE